MQEDVAPWCQVMPQVLFYAHMLCRDSRSEEETKTTLKFESSTDSVEPETFRVRVGVGAHNCVLFEFFVAAAMVVGVGALMAWHIRLISRGETSIEQHINKETGKKFFREGKIYRNPHDLGILENWRVFLGLEKSLNSVFRRLILPSAHQPMGDGLSWRRRESQSSKNTSRGLVDKVWFLFYHKRKNIHNTIKMQNARRGFKKIRLRKHSTQPHYKKKP